ncbi:hypothetical protein [Actinomadura sp. 3N407]|uniref:hypothetical protein n=1 Tax=Actinomadura sp. 3N407 TaxID=3457423 RepID=UPI003FCC4A63
MSDGAIRKAAGKPGKPRRRAFAAGALLAALTTTASSTAAWAAPADRTEPEGPSISGWGHIYFGDEQDREFAFKASGLAVEGHPPSRVPGTTGTFSVAHYSDKSHKNGVRFWGHVDCLVVGGRTATFTGVIDGAVAFGAGQPDISGLKGVRRGFSVHDSGKGRPDRLGFSWFMDPGDTTSSARCQGPAPFAYVDKGDYRTTEWLPPNVIPSAPPHRGSP